MDAKKNRAALARKLRAINLAYEYRLGVWTALADVAIEHCKSREHAAIREAVAPVIAVLLEANRITSPIWLRGEKLSKAIEMLRKLGGET
jgi:predicted kinase